MDDNLVLSRVTAGDFTPALNTTFTLPFENGQSVDVVLTDVRAMQSASGDREPFTLTFSGSSELVLPQRIYRFTHPKMATMDIFIVPIAASAQSATYEAIFA